MRKISAILSAVFIALSFAACAGNTEEKVTVTTTQPTAVEETTSETSTAEVSVQEESASQTSALTTTVKAVVETTLETVTTTAKPTTATTNPTTATTTKVTTTRPVKGILSNFESWDLYGNTVTNQVFKGKKLTMVNIWATYCSPCINEMPDLEKLHQEYEKRIKEYLFTKSSEIIEKGFDVVLDWGFWTKEERNSTKEFYKSQNINCELHYIEIDDETWEYQLNKRNNEILNKETKAYYLEHNRALEFASRFEKPDMDEVDVLV